MILLIIFAILYIASAITVYIDIKGVKKSFLIDDSPLDFIDWFLVIGPIINTVYVLDMIYTYTRYK